MKNSNVILLMLLLSLSFVSYGQDGYTQLPYFCGFESPSDTIGTYGWKFVKRAKIGHAFVVGEATHRMGSHGLYVSADEGVTASYSHTTSGSVVVAYKSFYLQKGDYELMFDYRLQGEDHENSDVMRVAFYAGTVPTAVAMNGFPQYALDNPFVSNKGEQIFKTTLWTQVEGKVTASEDGYYFLSFLFKEYGDKNIYSPGACIDNIQLDRLKEPNYCGVKPSNIVISNDVAGIKISWDGNADSYEIIYNRATTLMDTVYTLVKNIKAKEYYLSYSSIPEGVYNFRVRSLCSNDTSMWVEFANYIVYDESKHCLNYMDFTAVGTTCGYGNFKNPAATKKVYDFGYESRHSIHTVHYMEDEYDRLTGYKLKTVPEDQIASVRLGNWTEGMHGDSPVKDAEYPGGSPSGQIVYTYSIPEDKSVLLLHYAAVLQYASHHAPEEQTRILVEILNLQDQVLECASADFNARDVSEGNTRGWQTYQPKEGEVLDEDTPIKWLDWSVLGLNLGDYKGQTVKIRLTLRACVADYHFAYGYFTLDCTAGEVGGMSCTERADTLFVPEGFDYLWYVQGDKLKKPVSTERFFAPGENDINSYAVDLIYPENNGCYFTLYATVWPRVPVVRVSYIHNPLNCVNYIDVVNNSCMVDLKMDVNGNIIDTIDVPASNATINSFYWEIKSKKGTTFENGQVVSSDVNPRIIAPNEGDTFVVVVKGMYNSCEDVKEYTMVASEIRGSLEEVHRYICNGDSVEFNGKFYYEPGEYIDTLQSQTTGCDSLLKLTLEILVADTIRQDTTICSESAPYFWLGEQLDSTGVYKKGRPSSLGCDTLYYILNLEILESLIIKTDSTLEVCGDEAFFEIPYKVESGKLTGYSVTFSDEAKKVGFTDDEVDFELDSTDAISIDLPINVKPNKYSAKFVFYNDDCGNVERNLNIDVLYPSDVIAQRWNDFLGVKNADYNGNYKFIAYQWFLNGRPVEGFTSSQFYVNGEDLDFNGEYQVLLTREEDGISAMTCAFTPEEFEKDQLADMGRLVFRSEVVTIESSQEAKVYIYNVSGLLYSVTDIIEGYNSVVMPDKSGIYIMQMIGNCGVVSVSNIVVR